MARQSFLDDLTAVSTATLTMVLLKRGLRNSWLRGTRPLLAGQPRIAGQAFTLRFIAGREDLSTPEALATGTSTRAAIEAMPAGVIAVADTGRHADSGIFGDILCERLMRRGVLGLVADGVIRDLAGVRSTGLPVFCSGVAAPASISGLVFAGWQQPIGCGGVAVIPGDIIVADEDGAVVVPAAIAEEVAAEAMEQERTESWIMGEVKLGHPLPGLYPMNDQTRVRYESLKQNKGTLE